MVLAPSLSWLSNIPFYGCTTLLYPFTCQWILSFLLSWLLLSVMLSSLECIYLFTLSLKDFLIWNIFKIFIVCVMILLLFYVLVFFGKEACGILAPQWRIKSAPPALEGEVLTIEPSGKSQGCIYLLELEFSQDICPGVRLLDHDISIFSFLRDLHTLLLGGYTNLHLDSLLFVFFYKPHTLPLISHFF